ncbi:hypothetical protein [Dapis sp. BLCC M172]
MKQHKTAIIRNIETYLCWVSFLNPTYFLADFYDKVEFETAENSDN